MKYGQCWVFAGLLTTFMRTLGIASTSMTNFNSAHEHPPFKQECANYYYEDDNGKWKNEENRATCSIWNFHVWVDAWFKRDDVGAVPHNWQAIDATPQETSLSLIHI